MANISIVPSRATIQIGFTRQTQDKRFERTADGSIAFYYVPLMGSASRYKYLENLHVGDELTLASTGGPLASYYVAEWGQSGIKTSESEIIDLASLRPPMFTIGGSAPLAGKNYVGAQIVDGALHYPDIEDNTATACESLTHTVLTGVEYELPTVPSVGGIVKIKLLAFQEVRLIPYYKTVENSFAASSTSTTVAFNYYARSLFAFDYQGPFITNANLIYNNGWHTPNTTASYAAPPSSPPTIYGTLNSFVI